MSPPHIQWICHLVTQSRMSHGNIVDEPARKVDDNQINDEKVDTKLIHTADLITMLVYDRYKKAKVHVVLAIQSSGWPCRSRQSSGRFSNHESSCTKNNHEWAASAKICMLTIWQRLQYGSETAQGYLGICCVI